MANKSSTSIEYVPPTADEWLELQQKLSDMDALKARLMEIEQMNMSLLPSSYPYDHEPEAPVETSPLDMFKDDTNPFPGPAHTRQELERQKFRQVYIPTDLSDPESKFHFVGVNGARFKLPRNQQIMVPQTIFEILVQNGITMPTTDRELAMAPMTPETLKKLRDLEIVRV
jgi:hypothetical protein